MPEQSAAKNDNGGWGWLKSKAFPILLAALAGGALGGPGWNFVDDPRKYPWTSVEAEKAHEAIRETVEKEMLALEQKLARFQARQDVIREELALKPPPELLERVTRAEERLRYMQSWQKLDCPNAALPPGRYDEERRQ